MLGADKDGGVWGVGFRAVYQSETLLRVPCGTLL